MQKNCWPYREPLRGVIEIQAARREGLGKPYIARPRGTPGGIGEFIIGVVISCVGGCPVSNQVSMVSSYWSYYGANTFGVTIPMLRGIALLFWNGKA